MTSCKAGITTNNKNATLPAHHGQIEAKFDAGGRHFEVIDGVAWQVDSKTGRRSMFQQLYDPDFYQKHYATINGKIYRVSSDGNKKFPVKMSFREDFEGTQTIHDLIGQQRGWTAMTLMGPKAPSIKDYVRLRMRILNGQSDFLDNRVEPSNNRSHSRKTALRTYAVAPSGRMPLTKASLSTELLHFRKGEHVWYSAWYYLESGRPTTIVDIESSYFDKGAGMRVLLSKDLEPRLELKWPGKPTFYMPAGTRARLPRKQWFHVKLHYLLSEGDDGLAEMWLDGKRIISARGKTLPVAKALYDRLEIGITANPKNSTSVLYVDDVIISHQPIK